MGKDEIDDFLGTLDDNKDNSLSKNGDVDDKNLSEKNTQIDNDVWVKSNHFAETPYR
jgi:hypothetical protein